MVKIDFYEAESIRFVSNLLKNKPSVLRANIDLSDVLTSVRLLLDSERNSQLLESLLNLPKINEKISEDISDFVLNGARLMSCTSRFICGNHREVAQIILKFLNAAISAVSDHHNASSFEARHANMATSMGLTAHEAELTKLVYFYIQRHGIFNDSFNDMTIWKYKNFRMYLAAFLDISEADAQFLLRDDSPLFKTGMLSKDDLNDHIEMHYDLHRFLGGSAKSPDFSEALFEPLPTHQAIKRPVNVTEHDWHLMLTMLKMPMGANILLHGAPGTGKTTLALALSAELGINAISIRSPEDGKQSTRVTNLLCAMKLAEIGTKPMLIVVDEADQILGTRHSWIFHGEKTDKGWLNKTIEQSKAKIIWITNSISGIESSTMRRFSYSLEFKDYTNRERREIWNSILLDVPEVASNLNPEDISTLSSQYRLQPAQIADTVRQVAHMGLAPDGQRKALEQCLSSHAHRIYGSNYNQSANRQQPNGQISIEGLSADHDLASIVETLRLFSERLEKDGSTMPVRNMNLLLSGPPGTGKTEFAKLLSRTLGLDLIVRTASELQSKWVGETEKNIAAAFDEAERDQAVLFIDEADTFLWPRTQAGQSWQVSQVNEFLCQMENFRGILVCASNHMDMFDEAAIRRFNLKVRFDWLKADGKLILFRRVFGQLFKANEAVELNSDQQRRLASIGQLAPGDFKVVFQKHAFLPVGTVSVDQLIESLEVETRYKRIHSGGSLGFIKDHEM